jgi:hypothetical protein
MFSLLWTQIKWVKSSFVFTNHIYKFKLKSKIFKVVQTHPLSPTPQMNLHITLDT